MRNVSLPEQTLIERGLMQSNSLPLQTQRQARSYRHSTPQRLRPRLDHVGAAGWPARV